jgi:hypothetical protein
MRQEVKIGRLRDENTAETGLAAAFANPVQIGKEADPPTRFSSI